MERHEMIDLLTGVQSSKRNYYSELKTTVDELKKKNSQLEIINEVMSSFTSNFSVSDMLQNMLLKLKSVYPIDRVSTALENDHELVLSYVYPESDMYLARGTRFPKNNSLYHDVLTLGHHTVYHDDNSVSFFEKEGFQRLGLASVHLFPLKSNGKTIGVLSLGSRTHFQCIEEDLAFFFNLADQVAVCVENSRLFSEVLAGKQRWEETFRAVSDAILIIAPDGTVVSRNDAVQLDWPLEVGQNIRTAIAKATRSGEDPFQKTIETKRPYSAELHHENKIYDCSWYPLLGMDASIDAVILYRKNVTEKRQMEVQLMHSGQLAAIGEMAAGVAHELNNPLTAIIGNSQLLLRTQSNNVEMKPLLEDIDRCGKRCRTIIRSLLAFSRQDDFSFKPCSLNEAVSEALHLTRQQIEKQQISIDIVLDSSLPTLSGNLQQLSQVAVNLLMNAKDALEEQQVVPKKIRIQTKTTDSSALLCVTDNGSGIAQGILDDIFHPFFTTKDTDRGTGLGLSVSFGIAKAHGGTLFVETSQLDETTFILKIPLSHGGL
ncbi:ATP-binding protein [Sporosarcina sp. ACRSM]|uniref:GAF domain-containing sensor histidine kinase n=1 Tax=Sporosarcina sp. ACRSM TaxID=2918216 RepID=UPI001EF44237|nr:ATP-binding protein [Sporosarcina sp. ACRSM]MCG7334647.1 ATP-binding protein [Sporosarcina sp. ACRSM]